MKNEFMKNYDKLKDISNDLSNSTEPDIDKLIPMVEEATKSYQYCKERLENVKKALNEKIENKK